MYVDFSLVLRGIDKTPLQIICHIGAYIRRLQTCFGQRQIATQRRRRVPACRYDGASQAPVIRRRRRGLGVGEVQLGEVGVQAHGFHALMAQQFLQFQHVAAVA